MDAAIALADAFPPLDAGLYAYDAISYLLLRQGLARLLPATAGCCLSSPV